MKVLVLGYFGYNTNQLDGQTVKTRDVYRLVSDIDSDVDYYDTEDFKYRRLSIFKMFWKVMNSDVICYLPAHNNLKYIFPVIFFIALVFRVRIHYFVVGGWLAEYVENLPVHRFMLSKLRGIHVETKKLKEDLETSYSLNNVSIFPNFRFFNIDETKSLNKSQNAQSLNLVFASRVERAKGLDTLLKIADLLVERGMDSNVSIHFYGKKKDDYYDKYLHSIPFYQYKGEIQPQDVIDTISKYDALIFPTHYDGEGCPGILIEALAAGLPIIASNWKYNGEFVVNNENGFLCNVLNAEDYVNVIELLLCDRGRLMEMSVNSFNMSYAYSAANAKSMMMNILNKE